MEWKRDELDENQHPDIEESKDIHIHIPSSRYKALINTLSIKSRRLAILAISHQPPRKWDIFFFLLLLLNVFVGAANACIDMPKLTGLLENNIEKL